MASVVVRKHSTEVDKIILEVQKKILGERAEKLTPLETNKLFQAPFTAEFNLILDRALKSGAVEPDTCLLHLLPKVTTQEALIPVALCLRQGVDTNMYVNAPSLGTVHLLGYIHTLGLEEKLLDTLIIMLVFKGSRSSLPMFDKTAGKVKPETKINVNAISVLDWIKDQGYESILPEIVLASPQEIQELVDVPSAQVLSVILEDQRISPEKYTPEEMSVAIKFFSNQLVEKIPLPEETVLMDYKSLDDAVNAYNHEAFKILLSRGQVPSYLLVNKIILGMRDHKQAGKVLAVQALEHMLLDAVDVGVQLDVDQMSLLTALGRDVVEAVTKHYEEPYWKKVCRNQKGNKPLPEKLKHLAISLNIDPDSHASVCEQVTKLSRSDKEALKEAARKRQQLRFSSEMSNMNEFLGEKAPTLTCRNASVLPESPFDYNDVNLAYYRDEQGAIWCFTSETFESLLETGVNPYNSAELPPTFKDQVAFQLETLKKLGIDAAHGELGIYTSQVPQTFSAAIDSLSEKDKVSEKSSSKAVDKFLQLAAVYSVSPETIKRLTKTKMESALAAAGYHLELHSLSTGHALVTLARLALFMNEVDQNSLSVFFDALNTFSS